MNKEDFTRFSTLKQFLGKNYLKVENEFNAVLSYIFLNYLSDKMEGLNKKTRPLYYQSNQVGIKYIWSWNAPPPPQYKCWGVWVTYRHIHRYQSKNILSNKLPAGVLVDEDKRFEN